MLKLYLAGAMVGSVFYLVHHAFIAASSKVQCSPNDLDIYQVFSEIIVFGFHGLKIRKTMMVNLRVVMLVFCKFKENN